MLFQDAIKTLVLPCKWKVAKIILKRGMRGNELILVSQVAAEVNFYDKGVCFVSTFMWIKMTT